MDIAEITKLKEGLTHQAIDLVLEESGNFGHLAEITKLKEGLTQKQVDNILEESSNFGNLAEITKLSADGLAI